MTTKANGMLKWTIGIAASLTTIGAVGVGGKSIYTAVHRIDDRQTADRVRNTEGIAINAKVLASHGERLRALEECLRHVAADLDKLDTKLDRVLKVVE